MFSLIKQVSIALLSFSKSLSIKFVSLNNKSCMIRPFLIDLDPVELKHYQFMISLDKRNSNSVLILILTYLCVPGKAKDVNVKVFNMITQIEMKQKH